MQGGDTIRTDAPAALGGFAGGSFNKIEVVSEEERAEFDLGLGSLWRRNASFLKAVFWGDGTTWLVDVLERQVVGFEGLLKEEQCLLGEIELQETAYFTGDANTVRRTGRVVTVTPQGVEDATPTSISISNIIEATRFYECCLAALTQVTIWAPLLSLPEPYPQILDVNLSGSFEEAPLRVTTSKKMDIAGSTRLVTSREPTEPHTLWVGNLDLNYNVLPARADLSRWLPRGKEIYAIGLLGISQDSYKERGKLTTQILRHVGRRNNKHIATVEKGEVMVVVLARNSLAGRVHSVVTMGIEGVRPARTEGEDAVSPMVGVQLQIDETVLGFICTKVGLVASDIGWETAAIRSRVLTSLMSQVTLPGRCGTSHDPSTRFDHLFIFGSLGDEILVEVQKGNTLHSFTEGDLVLPKGGSLSQRVFYTSLPHLDLTPDTYDSSVPWGTIEEGRHAVGAVFPLPVQLPFTEALSTPSAYHSFEITARLKFEDIDSTVPLDDLTCTLYTPFAADEDHHTTTLGMAIEGSLPSCTFRPIPLHTNSQGYLTQQCLHLSLAIEGEVIGSAVISLKDVFATMWSGNGVQYLPVSETVKRTTAITLKEVHLVNECKVSGAVVLPSVSVFTDSQPLVKAAGEKKERDEASRQAMVKASRVEAEDVEAEETFEFALLVALKEFFNEEEAGREALCLQEGCYRAAFKSKEALVFEEYDERGTLGERLEYYVALEQMTKEVARRMNGEYDAACASLAETEGLDWGELTTAWQAGMQWVIERDAVRADEDGERHLIWRDSEQERDLLCELLKVSYTEVGTRGLLTNDEHEAHLGMLVELEEVLSRSALEAACDEQRVSLFVDAALSSMIFLRSYEALSFQALHQRSWLEYTEITMRCHEVTFPAEVSCVTSTEATLRRMGEELQHLNHDHAADMHCITLEEDARYAGAVALLTEQLHIAFDNCFKYLQLNEGVKREDILEATHYEALFVGQVYEELEARCAVLAAEGSEFARLQQYDEEEYKLTLETEKIRIDREVAQQRRLAEVEEEGRTECDMQEDMERLRLAGLCRSSMKIVVDNLMHELGILMRRNFMEEIYLREQVVEEQQYEHYQLLARLEVEDDEAHGRLLIADQVDEVQRGVAELAEDDVRGGLEAAFAWFESAAKTWVTGTLNLQVQHEFQGGFFLDLGILEDFSRSRISDERLVEHTELVDLSETAQRHHLVQAEVHTRFHLEEVYRRSVIEEFSTERWLELTDSLRFPEYPSWDDAAVLHNITKQGQVQVKVKEGRRSRYDHRWVVLRATSLSIYEEKKRIDLSFGAAAGGVPLNPCGFSLSTLGTVGTEALVFNAPSNKDRDAWVAAMLGYGNGKVSSGTQTERDLTDFEKVKEEALTYADQKYSKMVTSVVGKLEDNITHLQAAQRHSEEIILNTIHRRERDTDKGALMKSQEETELKVGMLDSRMERMHLQIAPPPASLQARIAELEEALHTATKGESPFYHDELLAKDRLIASLEEQLRSFIPPEALRRANEQIASLSDQLFNLQSNPPDTPTSLQYTDSDNTAALRTAHEQIAVLEDRLASVRKEADHTVHAANIEEEFVFMGSQEPAERDPHILREAREHIAALEDELAMLGTVEADLRSTKEQVAELQDELEACKSRGAERVNILEAQLTGLRSAGGDKVKLEQLRDALRIAVKHEGVPAQVRMLLTDDPPRHKARRSRGVQTSMQHTDIADLEDTVDYAAALDERFSQSVSRVKDAIPYNAYCMLSSALTGEVPEQPPSPTTPSIDATLLVSHSPEPRIAQHSEISLLAEAVQAARQEQQETKGSVVRLLCDIESIMKMYRPTALTDAIRRTIGVYQRHTGEGNSVELEGSVARARTVSPPRLGTVKSLGVQVEMGSVWEQRLRYGEKLLKEQAAAVARYEANEKELLELTTELSEEIEQIEMRARSQEQTYAELIAVHEEQQLELKHRVLDLELQLSSPASPTSSQLVRHLRATIANLETENKHLKASKVLDSATAAAPDGTSSRIVAHLRSVVSELDEENKRLKRSMEKLEETQDNEQQGGSLAAHLRTVVEGLEGENRALRSKGGDYLVGHLRKVVGELEGENRRLRETGVSPPPVDVERLREKTMQQEGQIKALRELLVMAQPPEEPASPMSKKIAEEVFEVQRGKLMQTIEARHLQDTVDVMVGGMLSQERLVNTVGGLGEAKAVEEMERVVRSSIEQAAHDVLVTIHIWMASEGRLVQCSTTAADEGEDEVEKRILEAVQSPQRERAKMFQLLQGVSKSLPPLANPLSPGGLVLVKGLTSTSYLNGKHGIIRSPPTAQNDRYLITFPPPFGEWALRPVNLTPLPLSDPAFTTSPKLIEAHHRVRIVNFEAACRVCLEIYQGLAIPRVARDGGLWGDIVPWLEECRDKVVAVL